MLEFGGTEGQPVLSSLLGCINYLNARAKILDGASFDLGKTSFYVSTRSLIISKDAVKKWK